MISEYFDNNELFIGTSVNGIRVSKPYKVNLEKVLYIISAKSEKNKEELSQQLHSLGIKSEYVAFLFFTKIFLPLALLTFNTNLSGKLS